MLILSVLKAVLMVIKGRLGTLDLKNAGDVKSERMGTERGQDGQGHGTKSLASLYSIS